MCEFEPGPAAALPGGIGISKLTVYDVEAPDGLVGGTPHVHLACSEGYCVIAATTASTSAAHAAPATTAGK